MQLPKPGQYSYESKSSQGRYYGIMQVDRFEISHHGRYTGRHFRAFGTLQIGEIVLEDIDFDVPEHKLHEGKIVIWQYSGGR